MNYDKHRTFLIMWQKLLNNANLRVNEFYKPVPNVIERKE